MAYIPLLQEGIMAGLLYLITFVKAVKELVIVKIIPSSANFWVEAIPM